MLSAKISKRLITAATAAALIAGALITSAPGRALADPYHNPDRREVSEHHDNGRHLGWCQHGRDFDRDEVRYTTVCDRDGDDCRTVPNYAALGWRVFAPARWYRR
jgi:hypothetical protein